MEKLAKKLQIRIIYSKPKKHRIRVNGCEYEVQAPVTIKGDTYYPLKKVRPRKSKLSLEGIY